MGQGGWPIPGQLARELQLVQEESRSSHMLSSAGKGATSLVHILIWAHPALYSFDTPEGWMWCPHSRVVECVAKAACAQGRWATACWLKAWSVMSLNPEPESHS